MLIVDAHLDLAWNALQWNRDLLSSAHTIRTHENGTAGPGLSLGTVALPDMRRGRVALCFATLLARSTGTPVPHVDMRSAEQAFGIARGQLAYYRALEQSGHARIIGDGAALEQHIARWQAWETHAGRADDAPPLGLVISMESADPILRPQDLSEWRQAGVRLIGPAHYGPGRYAGGTSTELGLTPPGVELVKEMERIGVILDMTHLSDQAFWQALEHYNGLVIASHNNCRALVPHQRQFSDEQLRAIIERGGVVGAAFDAWMLRLGWRKGAHDNQPVHLSDVVDHIDHVCQLAGNSAHAGIGSDLDGGFGREQSPADLDTIADVQQIGVLLAERGYSADDVAAIMHGNWLRVLRQAWG
ncbi:MAG TPA: membrane dipeptidase [Roseiflexaceae bacterium]|nr:membrane dipeptidase [Roseiflexaceae bacterium]